MNKEFDPEEKTTCLDRGFTNKFFNDEDENDDDEDDDEQEAGAREEGEGEGKNVNRIAFEFPLDFFLVLRSFLSFVQRIETFVFSS